MMTCHQLVRRAVRRACGRYRPLYFPLVEGAVVPCGWCASCLSHRRFLAGQAAGRLMALREEEGDGSRSFGEVIPSWVARCFLSLWRFLCDACTRFSTVLRLR